jgi:hypothetical protein
MKSSNNTGVSRWELAWIIPLSLVLSASVTAAFALVVYELP